METCLKRAHILRRRSMMQPIARLKAFTKSALSFCSILATMILLFIPPRVWYILSDRSKRWGWLSKVLKRFGAHSWLFRIVLTNLGLRVGLKDSWAALEG